MAIVNLRDIDRTAEPSPVLMHMGVGLIAARPVGEKVVGVQHCIALEFENSSMPLVRTGFLRQVNHATCKAAVLRR